MKYLFLLLIATTVTAQAETRCAQEVTTAVTEQAAIDFPGVDIEVVIPDLNNVGRQIVEFYHVPVVPKGSSSRQPLAIYDVLVDEVCAANVQPLSK